MRIYLGLLLICMTNISLASNYFVKADRFEYLARGCNHVSYHNLVIFNLPMEKEKQGSITTIQITDKTNNITTNIKVDGERLIYDAIFKKNKHLEKVDKWCKAENCGISIFYYNNEYPRTHNVADFDLTVKFADSTNKIYQYDHVKLPGREISDRLFIPIKIMRDSTTTKVHVDVPKELEHADVIVSRAKNNQFKDTEIRIRRDKSLEYDNQVIDNADYFSVLTDHPTTRAENKVVLTDKFNTDPSTCGK